MLARAEHLCQLVICYAMRGAELQIYQLLTET